MLYYLVAPFSLFEENSHYKTNVNINLRIIFEENPPKIKK